jgi:hypothetical protein
MAYVTHYNITFTNELSQPVDILIQKKDGAVQDVVQYTAESVNLTTNGDEGKYATICGKTLEMEFSLTEEQTDFFDAFMTAETDTYKVICTVAERNHFTGFILPDEGGRPFQDRPFTCKITATDRLGLLKEIPLTKPDGTNFDDHNSLIAYIAAILQKTALDLPIRIYDNIYHADFIDRGADIDKDFAQQSYVEYRTFLKDATTFDDCHTCLGRICKDAFKLFQWDGRWVLVRLGLFQQTGVVYYTNRRSDNGRLYDGRQRRDDLSY